jgi:hypothetical protein
MTEKKNAVLSSEIAALNSENAALKEALKKLNKTTT